MKWYLACEDENGVLVGIQRGNVSSGLVGLHKLGRITVQQLMELEKHSIAQHLSLTEESGMLTVRAKYLRKFISEAGKGAVGFIPIDVPANEVMTVIVEPILDSDDFELWWVHLQFE